MECGVELLAQWISSCGCPGLALAIKTPQSPGCLPSCGRVRSLLSGIVIKRGIREGWTCGSVGRGVLSSHTQNPPVQSSAPRKPDGGTCLQITEPVEALRPLLCSEFVASLGYQRPRPLKQQQPNQNNNKKPLVISGKNREVDAHSPLAISCQERLLPKASGRKPRFFWFPGSPAYFL